MRSGKTLTQFIALAKALKEDKITGYSFKLKEEILNENQLLWAKMRRKNDKRR